MGHLSHVLLACAAAAAAALIGGPARAPPPRAAPGAAAQGGHPVGTPLNCSWGTTTPQQQQCLPHNGDAPDELRRAPEAVALQAHLDGHPYVGLCYLGRPLLPGMPARVCRPPECLWSAAQARGVDLGGAALATAPPGARCARPAGGQRPHDSGVGPEVSFVLPVHGGGAMAARAALELFRTAAEVGGVEFVVVDDGSPPGELAPLAALLQGMHAAFGTKVVWRTHPTPRGFGAAAHAGARAARGGLVAFINSDLFVAPGWLAALAAALRARPGAAAAAPLLLGPGHLVAEAGGVLWDDGSAAGVGAGLPPAPAFNHARRADYGSAACLLVRRAAYLAAGGFDAARYGRGYYEDADLAMALRQAHGPGAVVFQPLAVAHHRGGGTFAPAERAALLSSGRAAFVGRWGAVLRARLCPRGGGQAAALGRGAGPALLWVDALLPDPGADSGSRRAAGVMRALLSAGYRLAVQPLFESGSLLERARRDAALRAAGAAALPAAPPERWDLRRRARPFDDNGGGGDDAQNSTTTTSACAYDAFVVARRPVYERVAATLRAQCPGVPVVFDTVDLHYLREARLALATRWAGAWDFDGVSVDAVERWLAAGGDADADAGADADAARRRVRAARGVELALVAAADVTLVVSAVERALLRRLVPAARTALVSNLFHAAEEVDEWDADDDEGEGQDPPAVNPTSEHNTNGTDASCPARSGVIFVGNMAHAPNRQALLALLRDVAPPLAAALPAGCDLHVVGAGAEAAASWLPPGMLHPAHTAPFRVVMHGRVSGARLRALYGRVRAAAAPLLAGAGVKGKVSEAMLAGVPVVATPIAAEGMHLAHGGSALLAATPRDFAAALAALHAPGACAAWRALAARGRASAARHFSAAAAGDAAVAALAAAGVPPLPPAEADVCPEKRRRRVAVAGGSGPEGRAADL